MAKIEIKRGATTFSAYPEDLVVVGVDTPHKKGEHHLWDTRAFFPLREEMVKNIARFGVKVPILIEASADPEHPYVWDGKQRVLHARAANILREQQGKPRIQIVCFARAEDVQQSIMTMRMANKFRKDDDILEDAEFAKDMLTQGCSVEDIALSLGVSESTITLWTTKVVELPEKLKDAVRGGLGVKAAVAIATKPEDQWDGLLAGEGPKTPAAVVDEAEEKEEAAPPEELPQRKADKSEKKPKKVSVAVVEGLRGKKWFKNFLRYKEHMPAEFVQGVEFVMQLVDDKDLPANIRKWVEGNRWDLGEISDPPSRVIANLISKTHKAEADAKAGEES